MWGEQIFAKTNSRMSIITMWKTKLEAFSALILLTKIIYVETVCVRIDPAQIFVDDAT